MPVNSNSRNSRATSNSLINQPIDWSQFEDAARTTQGLALRLIDDRKTLKKMVFDLENNYTLLHRCERHELLDYLVICDVPKFGYRIRLNFTTNVHADRPHDHRFSFTSLILKGSYRHIIHQVRQSIYEKEDENNALNHMEKNNPDIRSRIVNGDIIPLCDRSECVGDLYTLHHSQVHSTITSPDTLSLFIRGPVEKDRSIIFDREINRYWWRYGAHQEPKQRRHRKEMGLERYIQLRDQLINWGFI